MRPSPTFDDRYFNAKRISSNYDQKAASSLEMRKGVDPYILKRDF